MHRQSKKRPFSRKKKRKQKASIRLALCGTTRRRFPARERRTKCPPLDHKKKRNVDATFRQLRNRKLIPSGPHHPTIIPAPFISNHTAILNKKSARRRKAKEDAKKTQTRIPTGCKIQEQLIKIFQPVKKLPNAP